MSDFDTAKILASGPLFKSEGDRFARCRVLLLKVRSVGGKRPEFVVGIQTLSALASDPGTFVKRHRSRHFTRAVRLFCDSLLEQAQDDDMAFEMIFGPITTIAR